MRRMLRLVGAVMVAMLALSQASAAQTTKFFAIGGGLTVPTGDYKDYAKTGWVADAALGTNIGSSGKVFGFVDVFYGKNDHDTDGDSTTLMGGGANIGIQSTGSSARVYGYAGIGMQNHKFNSDGAGDGESDSQVFGRGAVGISLGSGRTTFWAEVGMIQGDTAYLPIMAGISFGW